MMDKRREPRPCQGARGHNPALYKLGNRMAVKAPHPVHPIAEAFKQARLASGLSQETVAARAGYDIETISRFERGLQSISVVKFADICSVVGLVLTITAGAA